MTIKKENRSYRHCVVNMHGTLDYWGSVQTMCIHIFLVRRTYSEFLGLSGNGREQCIKAVTVIGNTVFITFITYCIHVAIDNVYVKTKMQSCCVVTAVECAAHRI